MWKLGTHEQMRYSPLPKLSFLEKIARLPIFTQQLKGYINMRFRLSEYFSTQMSLICKTYAVGVTSGNP